MESLYDELKPHLAYGLKRDISDQIYSKQMGYYSYFFLEDEILEVLHGQLYSQLSQIIMGDLWGE